jgi:hypothetical protein
MISFARSIDKYVLGALIAFEALVCYNFYSREIAWHPPGNFDQSYYLLVAYRTQEHVLAHGFGQLVRLVGGKFDTGLALEIEGALSGLVTGGGRWAELLVNFLWFAVLQVVAFVTARNCAGSRAYGYMLLGLILCQTTPWYWAGGLFDFRFDFAAYCLYGVWICAVIRSKLFLDRRWAIGCGLIGALLGLSRFLTIVYLVGVSAGFAGVCAAIAIFWRTDGDLARRSWRRFYNLVLSVGVPIVVCTPFLIRNWQGIFEHYGVGQDARAHQLGLESLAEKLLFYPNAILRDQWGFTFVLGSAILLIASLIIGLTGSHTVRRASPRPRDETFLLQVIFLLGAIVGPIIALSMHADKSTVACSIVGLPAALLVVVLFSRAVACRYVETAAIRKAVIACSMAVFALGVATVFDQLSRHLPEYAERRDLMRLVGLNKWMVDYASRHGWHNPGISMDVISPWFFGPIITDTGYEEAGEFIEFHNLFGGDILGADRSEALSELAQSDFLVLTIPNSRETSLNCTATRMGSSSDSNSQWLGILWRLNPFLKQDLQPVSSGISLEGSTASLQEFPMLREHLLPFYQRLALYRNDLKAWADENMILSQSVRFENFTATVYVRPTATPAKFSGGIH